MTFNIIDFQNRFKERAEAVKNRSVPPVGGDERLAFIKQAEEDYQDYMLISESEFEILDDYAHHPTEISTTLKAVKETRPNNKIIAIFEPHRYTRTRDCWDRFLHCFNYADELYLCPIYGASEDSIEQ